VRRTEAFFGTTGVVMMPSGPKGRFGTAYLEHCKNGRNEKERCQHFPLAPGLAK
jgi:hypothetical protein